MFCIGNSEEKNKLCKDGNKDYNQEHSHNHGHSHNHKQTKAVINRLSKIAGHVEAIKVMVEDGRDCSEVLIQLSAIRSAVNGVSKVILKDHMEHCMVHAALEDDRKAIEDLNKAIDLFMK